MAWWQATLWALAGGFVVEGLEFTALLRRYHKWPWQVDAEVAAAGDGEAAGPLGYFLAELIRLAAGGVLGAALAGQITGPLPAVAIGAAAPVIAGHLAAYVSLPVASTSLDSAGDTANAGVVQPVVDNDVDAADPARVGQPSAPRPEPLSKREETT